jgi:hypothetical protein
MHVLQADVDRRELKRNIFERLHSGSLYCIDLLYPTTKRQKCIYRGSSPLWPVETSGRRRETSGRFGLTSVWHGLSPARCGEISDRLGLISGRPGLSYVCRGKTPGRSGLSSVRHGENSEKHGLSSGGRGETSGRHGEIDASYRKTPDGFFPKGLRKNICCKISWVLSALFEREYCSYRRIVSMGWAIADSCRREDFASGYKAWFMWMSDA